MAYSISDNDSTTAGGEDGVEAVAKTTLKKDFEEHHVNMIGFSTVLGIGLFLSGGKVVYLCGPGLAVIVYAIVGFFMWCIMGTIGEMTALFPMKGPTFEFISRFIDKSIGMAAAWMLWFTWTCVVIAEVVAVGTLFEFKIEEKYLEKIGYDSPQTIEWLPPINRAVWMIVALTTIGLVNLLPARRYGQLEYVVGCFKISILVLIILINVIFSAWPKRFVARDQISSNMTEEVIYELVQSDDPTLVYYARKPFFFWENSIGTEYRDVIWTTLANGSRTLLYVPWEKTSGFSSNSFTPNPESEPIANQQAATFAAFFTGLSVCFFGLMGWDVTLLTAAENRDLAKEETVKISSRKLALRVVLLYCLSIFTVSLNVPCTDESLRVNIINSVKGGQYSIFVLAALRNGQIGLAHFLNGLFISSATATGGSALYSSSRLLHAIACQPEAWPRWRWSERLRSRLERTHYGVPLSAVGFTVLVSCLCFLSAGVRDDSENSILGAVSTPEQILGRIIATAATLTLLVYALNCIAYLRFYDEIYAASQGDRDRKLDLTPEIRVYYDRNSARYPWKTRFQLSRARFGLVMSCVLIISYGWRSAYPPAKVDDLVASYIPIPFLFAISAVYYFVSRGFDPRKWHRDAEMLEGLTLIGPVVVNNPERCDECQMVHRRGVLRWPRGKGFTMLRFKAAVEFIWTWLK